MNDFNFQSELSASVLGTDLDGTLIPLVDNEENRRDLQTLSQSLVANGRELIFATGRHFESVFDAIKSYGLPRPGWIVSDVGSSIYHAVDGRFERFEPYECHLREMVGDIDRKTVTKAFEEIEGLPPQEGESQGTFKISYFCDEELVDVLGSRLSDLCRARNLPFECMASVDPFTNRGLLDLLPNGVSKAYALIWLSTHANFSPSELVYAGDSGNDRAALVAGFRAIAVGNMDEKLAQEIEIEMAENGLSDRFFRASGHATSGVLEGCRHFGLI